MTVSAPAATVAKTEPVEESPFRDRRFLVFAAGNSINNIGEAIYATALPLLAYHLTGSLTVMSLIAATTPAAMLAAPALGAVVDRWGSRAVVVPGLLLQAGAALVMNLLGLGGHAPLSLLVSCCLLVALGAEAYQVGWMTGVATMFPDRKVRARGTLNSLYYSTTLIGPVIVVAGLALLGYSGLLWINLATFFAPIAVWVAGVRPPLRAAGPEPVSRRRPLALAEGWRALRSDRRVWSMLVVGMLLSATCGTGLRTLTIYQLRSVWQLSDASAASLVTMMNAFMFAGNLLVAQRRTFVPKTALLWSTAARVLAVFLLAAPSWPVFVGALVLGGLATGARVSVNVMAVIKYLPAEVLGRVSGLQGLLLGGAALLSPLLTPPLVAACGIDGALGVLGTGAAFSFVYLARAVRNWD
jgi:MFS family permease